MTKMNIIESVCFHRLVTLNSDLWANRTWNQRHQHKAMVEFRPVASIVAEAGMNVKLTSNSDV